jgi:hypothetical protein
VYKALERLVEKLALSSNQKSHYLTNQTDKIFQTKLACHLFANHVGTGILSATKARKTQ